LAQAAPVTISNLAATADLGRREITEPDAGRDVGRQVRAVQVQRQGGPRAPPLPVLHASGIEGADIEGVEPPQAVRDHESDGHERYDVDDAADPGERIRRRRRRPRGRRAALQLVLCQLHRRALGLGPVDLEQELQSIKGDGARDADGGKHERALIAI
jgi:hypothetical protein